MTACWVERKKKNWAGQKVWCCNYRSCDSDYSYLWLSGAAWALSMSTTVKTSWHLDGAWIRTTSNSGQMKNWKKDDKWKAVKHTCHFLLYYYSEHECSLTKKAITRLKTKNNIWSQFLHYYFNRKSVLNTPVPPSILCQHNPWGFGHTGDTCLDLPSEIQTQKRSQIQSCQLIYPQNSSLHSIKELAIQFVLP